METNQFQYSLGQLSAIYERMFTKCFRGEGLCQRGGFFNWEGIFVKRPHANMMCDS